ncbi:hypothetical protein Tco_0934878 [Tanacetum coccineum]
MTKAKGDGGEGLYVRRRSGQRDMEQSEEHLKRIVRGIIHKKFKVLSEWKIRYPFELMSMTMLDVMMAMGVEVLLGGNAVYEGHEQEELIALYPGIMVSLVCPRFFGQRYNRSTYSSEQGHLHQHWNMSFNESGEYKKTFIGSGVGTGSVQVLQGVEFEVEPQEDHTFEGCDTQYSELFNYREDSNEAAFAVAEARKILCTMCSLTFNNTVVVRLQEMLNKVDDIDVYYWEYTPEIVRDQSGNTLRVSQSRFYNGKLVQTLLEGHSILSLEGSLSGDCDVEKNGKWSCIYAVGSQEYQMVCTRLDIASADVGMLDKFGRGLHNRRYTVFVILTNPVRSLVHCLGKINHRSAVDDTRMCRKLRSYDAAHDGFVAN